MELVLPAVMYVSFADPLARLAGKTFGSGNLLGTGKTLAGSATFFVAGTLVASLVCQALGIRLDLGVLVVGGLAATAIELFSGRWDNFTVPFFAPVIFWGLASL